jgi:hypothetical protein
MPDSIDHAYIGPFAKRDAVSLTIQYELESVRLSLESPHKLTPSADPLLEGFHEESLLHNFLNVW